MLVCARQDANICRQPIIISKTVHKLNLCVQFEPLWIRWIDFRCSEIWWPNRHCSEKKRIEHSSIRLFNICKYENSRKWQSVIWQSAVRKQYSAEKISASNFSATRGDGQFIYRPNAMSPFKFSFFLSRYKKNRITIVIFGFCLVVPIWWRKSLI